MGIVKQQEATPIFGGTFRCRRHSTLQLLIEHLKHPNIVLYPRASRNRSLHILNVRQKFKIDLTSSQPL